MAIYVARCTADGLNEGAVISQKALLVSVHDGHQAHLGQVKAFAQQVDTHDHLQLVPLQCPQHIRTLWCRQLAMHIRGIDSILSKPPGQVLCIPSRDCHHKCLLALARDIADGSEQ